ncbi:hypothetical protein ACJRO7_028925 [Eucalyptus globulus]|uniref:Uncharacterized protein n=1 Tax=Eucalyptus globulus TaxID=34317 RepID=A0ABD3K963_EUCGL
MSIIVDVSLPTDDGATCPSNACGTGSATTAGSSQARTFDLYRPSLVHRMAKLFQRQKLGKAVLEFAVSMTTGLLISQLQGLTHLQASAIVLALSLGFTSLWNGMLLHGICPRVASALEYIGMGIILVAFFGLVSLFLLPTLGWACWLCCGLSGLPFFLRLVLPRADEVASSAERLDQGIV